MNERDETHGDHLASLEEELRDARPLLSPATRSLIRSMIAEAGPLRGRPSNLRGMVAAYAASGAGLMVIAGLSAIGAGPL